MDTRTIFFAIALVSTGINSLVESATTDSPTSVTAVVALSTSPAQAKTTNTSNTKVSNVSSSFSGGSKNNPSKSVTTNPTTPTTLAPIMCKVGVCNGTAADCLNSTSKSQQCKSGERCALVQANSNGTYSSFSFSCSGDCKALTSQGKVACCDTASCTPDLTKPIHNAGDTVGSWNIISFLSLTIISALVV